MVSPSSFRVSAHFLTFFSQEIRPLRCPRPSPHSNCPSFLVYPARRSSVSGFFVLERIVVQMDSSSVWATAGRMFLQFVNSSC